MTAIYFANSTKRFPAKATAEGMRLCATLPDAMRNTARYPVFASKELAREYADAKGLRLFQFRGKTVSYRDVDGNYALNPDGSRFIGVFRCAS